MGPVLQFQHLQTTMRQCGEPVMSLFNEIFNFRILIYHIHLHVFINYVIIHCPIILYHIRYTSFSN